MLVNAYATHRSPPPLAFPHVLRGRRDRSDPELATHLRGFAGFVMQNGRPMTATRFGVLQHIERVQHHVSLEIEPAAEAAFAAWAKEANAIVFHVDASIRNPEGAVLVDPSTGDPAPGAELPFPADALARRSATIATLEARGVPTLANLPPVASATEVVLRAPGDVARRAVALFVCALRGESLAAGEPIPADEIAGRFPLARAALSPNERAFFESATPAPQAITNHVWRYESLAVLLWALGMLDELPFPSRIADVPAIAKLMLGANDAAFPARASLRDASAILDALDLHYRIAWATTNARVKKKEPPVGIDGGVVFERHYALNWLTCYGDADWDDVDTPT